MDQQVQEQLTRIEKSFNDGMDRVGKALERLAKIEEAHEGLRDNNAGLWKRVDDHEIRLRNTETLSTSNQVISRWLERGAWIAFVIIIEVASGRWTQGA